MLKRYGQQKRLGTPGLTRRRKRMCNRTKNRTIFMKKRVNCFYIKKLTVLGFVGVQVLYIALVNAVLPEPICNAVISDGIDLSRTS